MKDLDDSALMSLQLKIVKQTSRITRSLWTIAKK